VLNQPEPTDELEITSESGPLPSPPTEYTYHTNILQILPLLLIIITTMHLFLPWKIIYPKVLSDTSMASRIHLCQF